MIKRILITGGAGCLGSNLLEHLFKQGHELLVIDNFATGKKEVERLVKDYYLLDERLLTGEPKGITPALSLDAAEFPRQYRESQVANDSE